MKASWAGGSRNWRATAKFAFRLDATTARLSEDCANVISAMQRVS